MIRFRLYTLILVLVSSIFTLSGNNRSLVFQNISTADGLPHSDAKCFFEDNMGYIWIGTNSGLTRYDGYDLRRFYYPDNVNMNRINTIDKIDENKLIIATEGGLVFFDLLTYEFIDVKYTDPETEEKLKKEITFLTINKNKDLWFRKELDAIHCKLSNDTVFLVGSIYNYMPADLKESFIFRTIIDDKSNLWILHEKGVVCVSPTENFEEKFRMSTVKDTDTERNPATTAAFDLKNDLWLTTYQFILRIGLHQNGDSIIKSYQYKYDYPQSFTDENATAGYALEPTSIFVDKKNNIWIGTKEGIVTFNANLNLQQANSEHIQKNIYDKSSLSLNLISSILVSKNETLFIGTWGAGLNMLNTGAQPFYKINFGKTTSSEYFVRSVYEDEQNLWVGLGFKGLQIFNKESGKLVKTIPTKGDDRYTISDPRVRCIAKDLNNNFWVGTTNGLNKINHKNYTVKKYYPDYAIGHLQGTNGVQNIAVDIFNRIWCGSWENGVFILTQNNDNIDYETLNTSTPTPLLSNKTNFIYYDEINNQILITSNKGLDRLILDAAGNIKERLSYSGKQYFISDYLWPLQQESADVFWVGSLGGGISRLEFNGNSLHTENFTMKDGLPSNDVEGLLIDYKNNIWVSGMGISRFDYDQKTFWNFDYYDGLQGNIFKVGAFHKGSKNLYFGGTEGLTYFAPSEIIKHENPPKTIITNFKLFDSNDTDLDFLNIANNKQAINLNYNQNNFEISFSSLMFFNSQKSTFNYRLVGFNINYTFIKKGKNTAQYSIIKPGEYKFEVYGTNNNGTWSSEPAILNIRIISPWWLSKPAFISYFILIMLAFTISIRIANRFQRLSHDLDEKIKEDLIKEEVHQTKLRFFTNISHELKTPLSLIISPIEKLINSDVPIENKQWYYQVIANNANRLLRLVNEIIDFRRSETGKIELKVTQGNISQLVESIANGFLEFATCKNIQLRKEIEDCNKIWYDYIQTEKIIYNIISNALKHTKDGDVINIKTSLSLDAPEFKHVYDLFPLNKFKKYYYIVIRDTGEGIEQGELSQIFDRFYQAKSNSLNSSGIGLALVKSLTQLHQGYIRVSSEINVGTEFVVGLPITKKPLPGSKISEREAEDDQTILLNSKPITGLPDTIVAESNITESRKSILVVEDNDDIRTFLVKELSITYNVYEAINGSVGLKMAREVIPDVIITDVMMPEMDGNEMTKLLKNDLATSHIPIIVITAKTEKEHELEGTMAGADIYIRKPFSIKLLELYISNIFLQQQRIKNRYKEDALSDASELASNDRDKQFIELVISHINENMDDADYTLNELIREVGMSRTRFYEKIKTISGMTAKEFYKSVKLKYAIKLLVVDRLSVSETSYMVGFRNISHFTRSFKEVYGMSPTAYKSKLLKNKTDS